MLLNQNTLNLFGEKLFERARVTPPFKRANHLSNEACLLFFSEGGNNHYSQSESLTVTTGDGILMKCGNFFFDLIPDKESGNAEMRSCRGRTTSCEPPVNSCGNREYWPGPRVAVRRS